MAAHLSTIYNYLLQNKGQAALAALLLVAAHKVYSKLREVSRLQHEAQYDPMWLKQEPSATFYPDYFRNADGLWLKTREWRAANPVGHVFLCHGLGEHCDRYDWLARTLRDRFRLSVFAMDHQGHGMSMGDRCYFVEFEHLVRDYIDFVRRTQARLLPEWRAQRGAPGPAAGAVAEQKSEDGAADAGDLPPCFLLGHSMGGAISSRVAQESAEPRDHPEAGRLWPWSGVVLSAPLMGMHPEQKPWYLVKVGPLAHRFLPKLPVVPPVDLGELTRRRELDGWYKHQPVVYKGNLRSRVGWEFVLAVDRIQERAKSVNQRTLFLVGEADRIVAPQAVYDFFDNISSADKAMRRYPDAKHEIFQDLCSEEVLRDLFEWFEPKLKQ